MHGQKKRRKRTRRGSIELEGIKLHWELLTEPQWTSEDGYRGLRFSVRSEDERHRELILEYPFPDKRTGNGLRQIPQRPQFTLKQIEADVRHAMISGWDPESRGKAFIFNLAEKRV
jgi:hypothetical protein